MRHMRHGTLLLHMLLLLLFLPKLKTHPAGQRKTVALKDGLRRQNRAQKVINVPSETLWKTIVLSTNFYTTACTFRHVRHRTLLLPPVADCCSSPPKLKTHLAGSVKHSGPEGRNGARLEPKKSLTSLLKMSFSLASSPLRMTGVAGYLVFDRRNIQSIDM